MAENTRRNQLAAAVGAALTLSLAASPVANAQAANPFGLTELASGYMLASSAAAGTGDEAKKDNEGSCGEGRCGADAEAKDAEGSCGEGKCGADDAAKEGEGRCGEGRCGAAA